MKLYKFYNTLINVKEVQDVVVYPEEKLIKVRFKNETILETEFNSTEGAEKAFESISADLKNNRESNR